MRIMKPSAAFAEPSRPPPIQSAGIQYADIPVGAMGIRLVRLLPATTSGIYCQLFQSTLHDTADQYMALSYVWGEVNSKARAIIYVNNAIVHIKPNLYDALNRLRQRTQPVVFWVDSLCINQADDDERTQQVGIMRDIYAKATEVIIWLGIRGRGEDLGEMMELDASDHNSEDVDRRIRFHGDKTDTEKVQSYLFQRMQAKQGPSPGAIDVYGAFCVISLLSQEVPASTIWYLRNLDYSPPIMRGLTAIMCKSWWRRIWVVQEMVVAQRATVCYSNISIPWEAFARAAIFYESGKISENSLGSTSHLTYAGPLQSFSRVIIEMEKTRRNWASSYEPLALLPALRKFRARDASDKRDKVFALVGLVTSWGSDTPLKPDYGLGVWRVFWDTTIRLIERSKSLTVLAGTLGSHGDVGNLPSWMTDWGYKPELNEHHRLNNLTLYNASCNIQEQVRLHGSTLLEAQGYYVDRVVSIMRDSQEVAADLVAQRDNQQRSNTLDSEAQSGLLQKTVAEWGRGFDWLDNNEYVDGGDLGDAFWRTICGNVLYDVGHVGAGNQVGEFRRAGPEGLQAYRNWRRKVNPSNNRRTSIIGATLQDSVGINDDQSGKNEFQLAVEYASGSRKFFRTQKGYIGTGPKSVKVGDGVFILLGSRVPIILRTSANTKRCVNKRVRQLIMSAEQESASIDLTNKEPTKSLSKRDEVAICNDDHLVCYKVIGDAYVHGIMDGEMVWADVEQNIRRKTEAIYLI